VLEVVVPPAVKRTLTGGGEQGEEFVRADVRADGAGLLRAGEQALDAVAEKLHRAGDLNVDPARGQEVDDRLVPGGLPDHLGEEDEQRGGGVAVGRECAGLPGELAEEVFHDRLQEGLLGREVAEHRPDRDPGPGRDLLGRRARSLLGEDRLGRGQDPRAITAGVGPQALGTCGAHGTGLAGRTR
jgi:hypothetical protein